jgi:deoxyribonuclease-4
MSPNPPGGPVVFHPAYFGGMDKEQVYQTTKAAILEMMDTIKEREWNCMLAAETTGKHSALGSLEETIRLVSETGCSCCIDFAHLYARNYGKIDYAEALDKLKPVMPKLGNRLHMHFSGIEYTQKGERNHITIDHDKPPFRPLAQEIMERGLDVTIISESPVTWQDSLVMRKVFEELGYEF